MGTQTVECHQDYDVEDKHYSCANLVFDRCNLQCDGDQSCYNARIIDAPQHIECSGDQSCYGARLSTALDGSVSCVGEESCRSSRVGVVRREDDNSNDEQRQDLPPIAHLDCRAASS